MLEIINIFISSVFLIIPIYIFGFVVLRDKSKKENKTSYNIITIIVSIIVYTFISFWFEGLLKTIMYCLSLTITQRLLFKASYGKSLLATIIYITLLIIPDLLILSFSTILFRINKEFFYINIAGSIIGNILVSILMTLLIFILKKPLRRLINHDFSTNKKIILISLLTFTSIIIFFQHLINTFRLTNDIIGYLIVIVTLAVILLYLFKQKIDNDSISKKYDDLLNIMRNYENDIEEQRTMIHETRNELMTIKSKISDKEKESEIIKYIDSIIGDKVSSKMSKYSKFKYLPSNGIKGFFYYKFTEAESKEIKVSVNISKQIEDSFLGTLETKKFKDLVRIIGVYLDNAIEASAESKDKKLGIEIYLINDNIEIIISNTYANEINKEKIGIEKFSTKGKNHGHGLLLVNHILNNSSIFETETNIKNDIYVQKIKIKNPVN